MVKFQPGDIVTRSNHNTWWEDICIKYSLNPKATYTVHSCSKTQLVCTEWLIYNFQAIPDNFTLVSKEELIAARIKKLYAKCKTTAHWV